MLENVRKCGVAVLQSPQLEGLGLPLAGLSLNSKLLLQPRLLVLDTRKFEELGPLPPVMPANLVVLLATWIEMAGLCVGLARRGTCRGGSSPSDEFSEPKIQTP